MTHWSRCKAEALVDTLADRLEEKNVEALDNTLTPVKAEALLDRVAEERLPTFRSGEVEEVDDTVPDRQAEVKSKQRFGGV